MDAASAQARQEALETASRIDGWLTANEATVLYDLAKQADGPIVEIGSWRGRSTTALALGSMAGGRQTVYAVDPFIGPQEGARPTSLGNNGRDCSCSPELLRANLDAAGVDSATVRIVPKPCQEVLADVPADIALLFIDGAHDYASVKRDLELYLPRLRKHGHLVMHDVTGVDPGVVDAFDECIMTRPAEFLVLGRTDSAMVVKRHRSVPRNVFLACPGRNWGWGTITQGIVQASLGAHQVTLPDTAGGTGWDDFNALWAAGLNAMEAGEVTHFAMLHSDVVPVPGWIDLLIAELENRQADMVSTAIALKDRRGLTSCGIGTLENPWGAFRRFAIRELLQMPPTFGIQDTPYPDRVLLHNTGCWVCDLTRPVFRETHPDGSLKAFFDFPTRVIRGEDGQWAKGRESEDWFFSRQLHLLGARTFITRKVRVSHMGEASFTNFEPWGTCQVDEDTRSVWEAETLAATQAS